MRQVTLNSMQYATPQLHNTNSNNQTIKLHNTNNNNQTIKLRNTNSNNQTKLKTSHITESNNHSTQITKPEAALAKVMSLF